MGCFYLVACQGENSSSLRQQSLIYCSEGSPATFNPQQATTSISFDASAKVIFDTLVEFNPKTHEILPALATDWSISKDKHRYVFNLRKNVSFSQNKLFTPTRYFNAEDVIFSILRQLNPSHPYHQVGTGHYQFFYANGMHNIIVDVKKINSNTIEFILSEPYAGFLGLLAMDFSSIQSAEYAQVLSTGTNDKENFDRLPIGTGPFILEHYETDTFIRYYANENYWRKVPEIKTLVFAISTRPSLRLARLLTEECDVMAQPLPSQSQIIAEHPELTLDRQPGLNVAYWAFNTLKPPFNKLKVRQALSYAISREDIIHTVYNDAAVIARGPLPPNMQGSIKPTPIITQQFEKSRQLLEEADWNPDHVVEVWAMPVQRPYNPDAKKMAELIQRNLSQVGIKSRTITFKWEVFLDKVRKGQHETVLLGWRADSTEPDDFLTPLLSCDGQRNGTNRAFWCDTQFDKLIIQARSDTTENRIKLYQQAQKRFKQQLPWLPIAHAEQFIAYRKSIQNLTLSSTGGLNFYQITKARPE